MKFCVVAIPLALLLAEAQHTPRCFLMVSAWDVSMLLAPNVHDTTKILWVQFNHEKQQLTTDSRIEIEGKHLKFITPARQRYIRGSYNETTGCISGGMWFLKSDKRDGLGGGLTLVEGSDSSETALEWPKGYIYPMDFPIKPPFIGKLEGGKTETATSKTTFEECYLFGRDKGANGVQWYYKGDTCVAHTGSDIKPKNVHEIIPGRIGSDYPDAAAMHYRSQIFELIPYFGTTQERIPFGPDTVEPNACRELAIADKLPAKYVAHNVYLKKCFYATKGGIIPMQDLNHGWSHHGWSVMRVDLPALNFTMLDTLDCEP